MIYYSEGSELMDEEEARREFEKLSATARKKEDGSIEIMIPKLVFGEEKLDEDILKEEGEEVYFIMEYEEIERKEFDEETLNLFRELGYDV